MQSSNLNPNPITHPKFLLKTPPHEVFISNETKIDEQIKRNLHALITLNLGPFPTPFIVWNTFTTENQANRERMKRLKKIASIFQHEKLISHLNYTIDAETTSEITFISSKLKHLQNMTSLDLSSPRLSDPYFLKCLLMTLCHLKKVTSLTINFPLSLANLSALKRLNSLKSLSLVAGYTGLFHGQNWTAISSCLSKLTRLKSLHIALKKCLMISDYVLSSFAPIVRKLTCLENLSIGLPESGRIKKQSIINFFNSIKGSKSLKSLGLNLGRCEIETTPFDPISKGLSVLDPSQFKSLDLNYYSKPNDQCLEGLGTALQKFISIWSLSLDFGESFGISDKGLFELASGIQTLRSLFSLHLELSSLKNTNITVQIIATALKPLRNLTSLNLNFREQKHLNDLQLYSFSEALQGLTALKNLTLKFSDLYDVTEGGFFALSKALQGLSELSALSLELVFTVNLTNRVFIHLSSTIGGLKNLKELSINCLGCERLNKESTDSLGQALKNIPFLAGISLNFNYCKSLQGEGDKFLEIFKTLAGMKFLRKVQMSLPSRKLNEESCQIYTRHIHYQKISWT